MSLGGVLALWFTQIQYLRYIFGILATPHCRMQGAGEPGRRRRRKQRLRQLHPTTVQPESEAIYPFRANTTEFGFWRMLTDLTSHQHVAAITLRLGGAAKEVAHTMSTHEQASGGVWNGVQLDPVTYLVGALHARFGALGEEARLQSMTEMWAFAQRPGESINSLVFVYDTVRQRAATEGQFVMSAEGCALQMLRACHVAPGLLFQLLQLCEEHIVAYNATVYMTCG